MMRFFTAVVILGITFIYTFTTALVTFKPWYDYNVVEPLLIKNSYISEIKGDILNTNLVKKHLDIFNEYGHNQIVRYRPEEAVTKPRPIKIEIRKLGEDFYEELNKDSILAYATSVEDSCRIVLREDLVTEIQLRDTLIHELLHCYQYDHKNYDESDLMYYEDNENDKLSSIKFYAEEVYERTK